MAHRHWSFACTLALAVAIACSAPGGGARTASAEQLRPPDFGPAFSRTWHDGKAELAGYELTFPRYGELRKGVAVSIFVTEPFDEESRVKPEHSARADFQVIKLNLVEDFQTGIYDYNMMTSAFVTSTAHAGRPPGTLSKVSVSAQEWCGHAYGQALFRQDAVETTSHSYFEGEADQSGTLPFPRDGLGEDALWLWARGLARPALEPGQQVQVPILRSLQRARLAHVPLAWDQAALSRAAEPTRVRVPAGELEVDVLTARITRQGQPATQWTFEVERAAPHRIVRVRRDDGYEAALIESARLPYWQLHDNAHLSFLSRLGLEPRKPRMP
ncbi:MAG: hypothetical protein OXT09_37350 [Myxococcales bacterium]|nr:hypothetical protein [Myxococcales bacterium]